MSWIDSATYQLGVSIVVTTTVGGNIDFNCEELKVTKITIDREMETLEVFVTDNEYLAYSIPMCRVFQVRYSLQKQIAERAAGGRRSRG